MTSAEFLEQINKHENNLQNEINSANSNLLNKVKSQATKNQNLRREQVLGIVEKERAEAARIAAEKAAAAKTKVGTVAELAAEKSSANKVSSTLAEATKVTKAGSSLKKYGKYGAIGLGAAGLLGGAYYLGTRDK